MGEPSGGIQEQRQFKEGESVTVGIGGKDRILKFLGIDQKTGAVVLSESADQLVKPMRLPKDRFIQMIKSGEVR